MNRRKVIARKPDGQVAKGYLETIPDLSETGNIPIVSLTEETIRIQKAQLKALFFVKRFSGNKEYSEIKFFENQPKIDGLKGTIAVNLSPELRSRSMK